MKQIIILPKTIGLD